PGRDAGQDQHARARRPTLDTDGDAVAEVAVERAGHVHDERARPPLASGHDRLRHRLILDALRLVVALHGGARLPGARMASHRLEEALVVGVAGAVDVAGDVRLAL